MPDPQSRVWWMSVALTTQAVRDRVKTQTRRDGWLRLQAGDQLALCPKYRGVRRADRELIVIVDVVGVRREPLEAISPADVAAEGFPGLTPAEFVDFFCSTHRGSSPAPRSPGSNGPTREYAAAADAPSMRPAPDSQDRAVGPARMTTTRASAASALSGQSTKPPRTSPTACGASSTNRHRQRRS